MAMLNRVTALAIVLAATVSVVAVAQTVQATDVKSARAATLAAQRAQDAAAEAAAKAGPAATLGAPAVGAPVAQTAPPGSTPGLQSYPDYSAYTTVALEAAMQKKAIIERKLLMPMRDGVGLSTDIFRPKGASAPFPTIFLRNTTPPEASAPCA